VRILVTERLPIEGSYDLRWSQRQWRGYGWDGQRFRQVDGQHRFGPNPHLNDLSVAAGDLVFGAPDGDGIRIGEVTVTVRNAGPGTVGRPLIRWDFGGRGIAVHGDGWRVCRPESELPQTPEYHSIGACLLDPIEAGRSRTVTVRFQLSDAPAGTATVEAAQAPEAAEADRSPAVPPDPDTSDNIATITVR